MKNTLFVLFFTPLAADTAKLAKKIAQIPGLWEMAGAFLGVLLSAYGLFKGMIWIAKKMNPEFMKDPILVEMEKANKHMLEQIENLEGKLDRIEPFVDLFLPERMPLERTPLYEYVEKWKQFDPKLGKDILESLVIQQQANEAITLLLKYLVGEGSDQPASRSIELLLGSLKKH